MKRKQAPKKHRSKQPVRKARRALATLAPIASPARAPEPAVKYSRIWP